MSLTDNTLMARLELSGLEYRVLMAIMSHVPEKGGADAFCTVQEIADQLVIAKTSAGRAFRVLADRRIIMKIRDGRWHVNTWLMFNGDFDSWNAEVDQDPEPIWMRGVDAETGEIK